jgi:hypothetical protein
MIAFTGRSFTMTSHVIAGDDGLRGSRSRPVEVQT